MRLSFFSPPTPTRGRNGVQVKKWVMQIELEHRLTFVGGEIVI